MLLCLCDDDPNRGVSVWAVNWTDFRDSVRAGLFFATGCDFALALAAALGLALALALAVAFPLPFAKSLFRISAAATARGFTRARPQLFLA